MTNLILNAKIGGKEYAQLHNQNYFFTFTFMHLVDALIQSFKPASPDI